MWLEPHRVLDWAADEVADWYGMPMTQRLLFMGVCVPALLDPAITPEVLPAYSVLSYEGLAEAYHTLPYPGALFDQPAGLVEAFSVIRRTKNEEQVRDLQEQRAAMNRQQWSAGTDG